MEADIDISNQLTSVDKLTYTSIDYFPQSITGFVPDDKRQNPIDFNDIFTANDPVTLELPAAAEAESMPADFSAKFKDIKIDAKYTATNNKITLHKKMEFNSPIIYSADFVAYKAFINSIKAFNSNNIVIKTSN